MKFKSALLLLAVLALASCRGGRPPKDNAMSRYIADTRTAGRVVELIASVSPSTKEPFHQGDTILISYKKKADTLTLDSAVLYIRGVRQGAMNGPWPYITAADHSVGRVPYRITAYQGADSTVRVGEFVVRPAAAPVRYGYHVVRSYPHDPQAYTQGLFWHEGMLYESTGLTGQSTLRKTDLTSGDTLLVHRLDDLYFGEGTAILDGKIYQLTWQQGKGFVYDARTFDSLADFAYAGEGWGLTTDGEWLYMSNGSEKIQVLDPKTFRAVRTIDVYSDAGRKSMLNELEWIEGEIWANVYLSDEIVRIDPQTGVVLGVIDLSRILPSADKDLTTDVLNGIAYDPATKRIFVTGKNWKKLFEIEVVEQ
jgi:glutamine cyclotransferase